MMYTAFLCILAFIAYFCEKIITLKMIIMRKLILILFTFTTVSICAEETIVILTKDNKTRTEDLIDKEPSVIYDDESNTVEVAIEAEQYFEMKVIDISGTVVFTCPVLMVDGTPTNYQLPELPAGIYTLKVESPEVTFEGTLVIE